MKTNFLFHVPGASDIFDKTRHKFPHDTNWLDIDQLKALEHKPKTVEVIQRYAERDRRSGIEKSCTNLGRFSIDIALLKFGD